MQSLTFDDKVSCPDSDPVTRGGSLSHYDRLGTVVNEVTPEMVACGAARLLLRVQRQHTACPPRGHFLVLAVLTSLCGIGLASPAYSLHTRHTPPGEGGFAPCSMSGTAVPGGCRCDPPWTGDNCSALDELPYGSSTPKCILPWANEIQATWGGSPIQADDGTYHLFFSWIRRPGNSSSGPPPSIKSWYNLSVVAHAKSMHPDRGYTFQRVVLEPRGGDAFDGTTTHGPTVVRLPNKTGYALFFMGLNCNKFPGTDCVKHQWIGSAHATSLDGPWERPETPVLTGLPAPSWEGGMVANPSVLPLKNGTLLMAYRGLGDGGVGMAVSPRWDAPFTRLSGGAAVLGPASPWQLTRDEDMFLFHSSRGIQMLLHQEQTGVEVGAHAYSLDQGVTWRLAGPAYNTTLVGATTDIVYTRRERPQLLLVNGTPSYLFNGVQDSDGYTTTVAVPLQHPAP